MAENTYQTQIIREAEEIEDYKLKLLEEAEKLAYNVNRPTLGSQLPAYQVAGFTPAQLDALKATKDATIGSTFKDYLTAANTSLGGAYDTTQEAAAILRDADLSCLFGRNGDGLSSCSQQPPPGRCLKLTCR
jgi:hypothetical protein